MPCGDENCKVRESMLYALTTPFEDYDIVYVFATSIREAISKYRVNTALLINSQSGPEDPPVDPSEIDEPECVTLIAGPDQVIL